MDSAFVEAKFPEAGRWGSNPRLLEEAGADQRCCFGGEGDPPKRAGALSGFFLDVLEKMKPWSFSKP